MRRAEILKFPGVEETLPHSQAPQSRASYYRDIAECPVRPVTPARECLFFQLPPPGPAIAVLTPERGRPGADCPFNPSRMEICMEMTTPPPSNLPPRPAMASAAQLHEVLIQRQKIITEVTEQIKLRQWAVQEACAIARVMAAADRGAPFMLASQNVDETEKLAQRMSRRVCSITAVEQQPEAKIELLLVKAVKELTAFFYDFATSVSA